MRSLLLCLTLIAAALPVAADDAALQEAIDAARAAFDAHDKVRAGLSLDARIPMGANRVTMFGSGTVAYQKDGNRYLQILNLKMPEPYQMEADVRVLSNGTQVWITRRLMGTDTVEQKSPDLLTGAVPPGGALLFDLISEDLDLKRLPDTEAGGKSAYAFEGVPKTGTALQFTKAEFEVDQETGLLREARLYESEGALTVRLTQTGYDFSPDLSGVDFTPPTPTATSTGSGAGTDAAAPAPESQPTGSGAGSAPPGFPGN